MTCEMILFGVACLGLLLFAGYATYRSNAEDRDDDQPD